MNLVFVVENEPSTSVLDSLKAGNLFLRYAIQKGVTIVVQPGQDEGTNSVVARVVVTMKMHFVFIDKVCSILFSAGAMFQGVSKSLYYK